MSQLNATIQHGDSLLLGELWPSPIVIVSDGPYGIGGYSGDLDSEENISSWYEPHIAMWAKRATARTTLWFFNTEIGWAETHPMLKKYGWVYRACNLWNKGIAHAAGNSNTKTLRLFPIVTEVCAHYVRQAEFLVNGNPCDAQAWLRSEWARTGLPFSISNKACGVKNAATRKYLTKCHLWYFPPADIFERMALFANDHGEPNGRPYFSMDGSTVLNASAWECMRAKFNCPHAVTNVWSYPAVRGPERVKANGKAVHPNQKPIELMDRIILCSSDQGDVVWEPFGGLCSAALSADRLKRAAYAAEIEEDTYRHALARF